ncbi:MAG: HlyC/CorC family transporter [Flavobacteriales bacterium]|jgi:putative hemolysin|nr:HlyC/CorC family transporter [Flavobacteriales bacterium]MBT4882311.1 HlyC/CorC family transporter [Flavobacteriales bacterium]MDG1348498.1 hemolysin family protein [Flavobacteriales bacterium]
MLISIAVITLLFSAFFSGVEIAFISANKLKLELDKNSGKFPSNIIAYFSKNESDFITTMLVGNNIALVVYGIVMTQILTPPIAEYLHSDAALLLAQTIITTLIVLVTAEFLPKAIFRIYPNQILSFFSIPIWLFFVFFRPVALLMLYLSKVVLKYLLGQNIEEGKQVFGKTDLDEYLSNVKSAEGVEDSRVEVEMLQNVLDLTDKKLRECMIPRTEIVAMDILSSIQEIKDKFIATKLSKILIFKGNIDKVIGYIHSSDLFRNPKNVRSILLPIPFVPESMSAMQLLNQFIESNKGIALVVDEFGGTSGMLTIEDVTEEIVGEIVDEHDVEEITDKQLEKNQYQLFARLDIELVNKKYDLDLPESDEYETIAGLILHHLEEIPKKDDVISLEEFRFTVIKVNDTAIQEVQLEVVTR